MLGAPGTLSSWAGCDPLPQLRKPMGSVCRAGDMVLGAPGTLHSWAGCRRSDVDRPLCPRLRLAGHVHTGLPALGCWDGESRPQRPRLQEPALRHKLQLGSPRRETGRCQDPAPPPACSQPFSHPTTARAAAQARPATGLNLGGRTRSSPHHSPKPTSFFFLFLLLPVGPLPRQLSWKRGSPQKQTPTAPRALVPRTPPENFH